MKKYMVGVLVFYSWLIVSGLCGADTIYLKNGNQIEGIITKETDEFVYIQMPLGNISLSKSAIESIQRSPAEDVQKTKEKWAREQKRTERQEAARTRFEERQRAKGLIQYKGTWVTPEKLAQIKQQEEGGRTSEEREKELADLKQQVETLNSENLELKEEIARLRSQIEQHSQEQIKLSREMLQQQKEALEFQKETEKRSIGQRPPHIWVAPKIDKFTPYPTPSD